MRTVPAVSVLVFAFVLAVVVALVVPSAVAAAAEPPPPPDDLEREVARMAKVAAAWSPSFSPDGEWVAFVSNLTGVPQVWKVEATGGFPILLTDFADPVGGVDWSAAGDEGDGNGWLAFGLAPGGGMNQQVYRLRPDGTGLERLTAGGRDNNWLAGWDGPGGRYLAFSSNRHRPQAMDVYLWDATDGTTHLLAENPGIGTLADLDGDGRRAVVFRMRNRGDGDLFLVDRESGEERLLTPHEGPGSFDAGRLSPDGRTVWLSSNAGRDRVAFARVDLVADGTPGPIEVVAARDDAELSSFVISDDGGTAVLLWNVAGRSEMEVLALPAGERVASPELPGELAGDFELSPDGGRLAVVASGATQPADVWILARGSGERAPWSGPWRQLTRSPHVGVDLGALVAPELVRYRAHDGLELSGWLYRPPGVTAPAPYVLSFHGGPEGQAVPGFRDDFQALVARGIGVFTPNVRGSAGFGKRFVNLDNGRLRFDAVRDIESSVAVLVERGIADPERLGIMGGSYGGYMTMAGLADYPELFAAGANLFGVVNFATFFAETEPWMAEISKVEYGDPESEAELLRELSPIHRIDRVTAPTLVLHGANDTNVPVVEAEQVVERLRARGVPVEYVLFPDEGHGFQKEENRVTSTVALVRWFEEHLKEPSPGGAAGG